MGCKCNQKSDNWYNLEWVITTAQKMANIKQVNQVVFKTKEGYSFTDADEYRGVTVEKLLQYEQ